MEGSLGVRKGTWTREEDDLLRACIQQYGEGNWNLIPRRAGLQKKPRQRDQGCRTLCLNRCRKSCRLRWLNYLKPEIKRGNFAEDEVDMIIRFHRLLGNRWTLIAGRLPGRTANDVKNFWNTYMRKKNEEKKKGKEALRTHEILKPQPRRLSKNSPLLGEKQIGEFHNSMKQCSTEAYATSPLSSQRTGQIIGWKVCWRNWEVAHVSGAAHAVHAHKKKISDLISRIRNSMQ